jgi:hypothetical protein
MEKRKGSRENRGIRHQNVSEIGKHALDRFSAESFKLPA